MSVWNICWPDSSKSHIYFDAKIDKVIGFTYSGTTTDTEINYSILEEWRKVLSDKISKIGVDGIFHAEVYSKEVFIID